MVNQKLIISIIILIISYFLYNNLQYREGQIVETRSGQVKGIIESARDGKDFYSWLGIPYAQSPVGDLRFASPKPAKNWGGIFDASAYGARCAQVMIVTGFAFGEEDCLFINVHAPKSSFDNKKLLPVIINVHAGAFVFGASQDYPPDYFMQEEIIFVSFNYRLGQLGFMSTGDDQIRGNMGLKDQALALKWTNENVKAFGGDPSKITIMGLSAGAVSVHYLTLSKTTRGLFQKAIAQSGNALLPWGLASKEKVKQKTKSFAQSVDCPTEPSSELVKCLRTLPLHTLLAASTKDSVETKLYDPSNEGELPSPIIEGIDDEEAFITQTPYDIIVQGKAHKIPMMMGVTKDEGLLMTWAFYRAENSQALDFFVKNFREVVKKDFEWWKFPKKVLYDISDFYFPPNVTKDWTPDERIGRYTELFNDAYFFVGTSETADAQRKYSPMYLYFFERYMQIPFGNMGAEMGTKFYPFIEFLIYVVRSSIDQYILGQEPRVYGVSHGTDAPFYFPLFGGLVTIPKKEDSLDYKISKDLVKLFVDFAYDDKSMEFRGTKFLANEKEGPLQYLRLDEVPEMMNEPFEHRTKFWKSLNYAQAYSSNKTMGRED